MNLNESIISIRVKLQETKLNKSGHNRFAGFDYFELADFLPTLNKLMMEHGVNDQFTIKDGNAVLYLHKDEETKEYMMPFIIFDTPLNSKGIKSMQDIQYLGALNTYYKRYLYLNAFGITDGEVIDSMNSQDTVKEEEKKEKRPSPLKKITTEQIDTLVALYDEETINKYLEYEKVTRIEDLKYNTADTLIKRKTGDAIYIREPEKEFY